jgi:hypothetical protein
MLRPYLVSQIPYEQRMNVGSKGKSLNILAAVQNHIEVVERKLLVAINSSQFDSAAQKRSTPPGDFFIVNG